MLLPALEFLVRVNVGVGIIERGHETQGDLIVRLVIQEPPAPGIAFRKRPTLGVDHAALHMLGGVDVPQFLDTDAVDLRLAIAFKVVFRLQLLCEMPARALCEQSIFCEKLHARLIVRLVAAILGHAHVARGDAAHRASIVIEDFSRREAWKDLDAEFAGLFGQPAAKVAKAAGVIAVVRHERGHRPVRQRGLAGAAHHPMPVVGHGHFGHRAALLAPFGQKLVQRLRIDHGSRENMRPDFRAFFKDTDR